MIEGKREEDRSWLWARGVTVNPSGVLITDPNLPDNPIVYANPGFEQLTGYTTEEVIGRNCRFLQGSDREQPALEKLRVALREGRECQVVLRNYKKNGTPFWNELSVSPLRDEEGRLVSFVGVQNDVTERMRAEEARLRLAALVEHSNDAIIGTTLDSIITSWNRGAEKLYGYSAEEAMGQPISILVPPDRTDEVSEIFEKIRQGEGVEYREIVHTTKDGRRIYISLTVSPIKGSEGAIVGASTVARDITERKEAEAKLRSSEAELRALFSAMNDVILMLDSEGRYLRIAPTNPSLLYKPSGDLVGKTLHEVFPAEQADVFLIHIRRALETRQPVNIEYSLQINGEEIWFAGTLSPMPEGPVTWVARDVTERKRVERELIERARQAALGEDVGAAFNESGNLRIVLQRCAEAIIRRLDATFARIWTLDEEENVLELQASAGIYTHLDGAHSRVRVGEFKIGLIAQERLPYLTNDVVGDPRIHDKEWARREGMVAFAGYPLIVEDRLVGVVAMFAREQLTGAALGALASVAGTIAQGIERKRAEESLKAYAARLNQSNRELQDFAYVASHDLQEPLRKVRTFGDRLSAKYAEVLGEQGRDYLERMESAAARMQDLIDDLLELSRVTTKAQPFASVDLDEVTQDVISDLETRIDQVGGRVEVSGLPTVEADRPQMRQLLQNLIGNALKFHREQEAPVVKIYGGSIHEREEEPNGRPADSRVCQILVEDNGIGFDEKHLERVFVPFQRLHGRAAYEGTGMGLAICRKVVERHGGNITAKSTPGQGTTFIVTLPVKQSEGNPRERRS